MDKTPDYKAILADLDGTVNRGRILIDGAKAVYDNLASRGVRWLFLSNNASSLAKDLAEKITELGLDVAEEQVVNSASALIYTLKREHRGSRVMVIGEPRLTEGLEQAGAVLESDPLKTDIIVTAMDRGFTYEKLARAHIALQHGARFWATNLDPTFPVVGGFLPGAGSIAAAVTAAAGRPPDRVFGKPFPDMARLALEILDLSADCCLVVGDRMETDILFARNAGMDSALVLTGATSRSDLERYDYAPDHILQSIGDVAVLFDGTQYIHAKANRYETQRQVGASRIIDAVSLTRTSPAGTIPSNAAEEGSRYMTEIEKLYEMLKKVQEPKGYFFSNDKDRVFELLDGLLVNKARYGYMCCPCRLAANDREKDRDIICPCVYRAPDVAEYGSCYCNLYVSQDWSQGKVAHEYVPERRPETLFP